MTYVVLSFDPSEVGFAHPLSEELVTQASHYIREQLNSVISDHDDTSTRFYDKRRTHDQLNSSSWIIKYKANKVLVTNQIAGEDAQQFKALYYGNGTGPICAMHMTRQIKRGWSSKDGHKSVMLGGKKPIPGTYGDPYPGMLKFYDKRNGMWQYRSCVKPISASIIQDFNRDIKRAVFVGLEMARYELYDRFDKDTEGANETEDSGMTEPLTYAPTIEEAAFTHDSKTKGEKDLEEYRSHKLEEEQVTMDSQIAEKTVQEKARSIRVKAGLEQPKDRGAKPQKESFWSKFKSKVTDVTDTVANEVHKMFGVTK